MDYGYSKSYVGNAKKRGEFPVLAMVFSVFGFLICLLMLACSSYVVYVLSRLEVMPNMGFDLAHFPCALSIRVHAARCFLS